MALFPRRLSRRFLWATFFFMGISLHARGDAALLLEEPFGQFGDMNPTGHAAIYLNHVCAASPTELRLM